MDNLKKILKKYTVSKKVVLKLDGETETPKLKTINQKSRKLMKILKK